MVRHVSNAVVCALGVASVAGCQYNPNAIRYPQVQPDPKDVAGVWTLDLAASDWKPPAGDAVERSIELKADGSAVVTNVPDVWNSYSPKPGFVSESGTGTWAVEKMQNYWIVRLHYVPNADAEGEKTKWGLMFNIAGQSPPYRILAIIGDPDEGKALEFVSRPPAR